MIDQVAPRDLADWMAQGTQDAQGAQTALLLDVRQPGECQYVSVQLPPSELLQWPMHTIPARCAELDPSRPVAVLCHHGGRSMQVALYLSQCGFARVANIAGGIDAWAQQLDPTLPRY